MRGPRLHFLRQCMAQIHSRAALLRERRRLVGREENVYRQRADAERDERSNPLSSHGMTRPIAVPVRCPPETRTGAHVSASASVVGKLVRVRSTPSAQIE